MSATDPILVGNIYRMRPTCYCGDQLALNDFYFKVRAVSASGHMEQELANVISGTIAGAYTAILSQNALYLGIYLTRVGFAPAPASTTSNNGATIGVDSGAQLPFQVTGLLTLTTALAGRKYRGRAYIPFPTQSYSAGVPVRPTAAYATLLDAIGTLITGPQSYILGGPTAVDVDYGIFHRAAGTITPTINWHSNRKWATQRRRGNYGRANSQPSL